MNCIIMAEIETDAPVEAIEILGNLNMEINVGGMVWKPYIRKIHLFSVQESEEDENAIGPPALAPRKRRALSKFNMGMHNSMSLVAGAD